MLLPESEEAHQVFFIHFHDRSFRIQSFVFPFEGITQYCTSKTSMDLAGSKVFSGFPSHHPEHMRCAEASMASSGREGPQPKQLYAAGAAPEGTDK